jgi:hypothetical protein
LTFTAHANDADVPSQRIIYSLDAGAPTNATINPINGLFVWTPLPRQAPSINLIPLLASDDGISPLGTRQAFLVTVALPPQLGLAPLNGSQLAFAWSTFPGQTYQVECKDNLDDPVWIPLSVPLPGNGALLALTNYVGGSLHRFFRLKVPPLGVSIPVYLPRLDLSLTSNQLVFTWPTLLGQSYEVEYCDDLGAGLWATSGDAIAGTGGLLTLTNQLALTDQRFYRLKLLPQ